MIIKTIKGISPNLVKLFAESATLIGEVIMGDEVSVWYHSVVRGDVNSIKIGNKVNIQDGAVIHATYKTAKTNIGNNVSIGHNAIVHGCTIDDNVIYGKYNNDNSIVGSNSILHRCSSDPKHNCITRVNLCWSSC